MAGKFFLVDTTRCTACRGCQVACKQWNKLPASETIQWGCFQNPKLLDGDTYRLVRFAEHEGPGNSMAWYFFTDACRHCLVPPCKIKADQIVKGAVEVDENGAVIYNEKSKDLVNAWKEIKQSCPWSIPCLDKRNGRLSKCHMCHDRVKAGLLPACAKSCPTGALMFGDEAAIKKLAEERLKAARLRYGAKAQILDPADVRVLYLVVDDYDKYMRSA